MSGLSMARVIGTSIRERADRLGIEAAPDASQNGHGTAIAASRDEEEPIPSTTGIGPDADWFFEGVADTPEERIAFLAELQASGNSIRAGRGTPGDVAMLEHRAYLAEIKARPWPAA